LYIIFGLLRKTFDKPKTVWITYWSFGLIALLGLIILLSIKVKIILGYVAVGVIGASGDNNFLLYGGLIYFIIMLSLFYFCNKKFWNKKGQKYISIWLIFWILAIFWGYLLYQSIPLIARYYFLFKILFRN
jgi:hypothetical protein